MSTSDKNVMGMEPKKANGIGRHILSTLGGVVGGIGAAKGLDVDLSMLEEGKSVIAALIGAITAAVAFFKSWQSKRKG